MPPWIEIAVFIVAALFIVFLRISARVYGRREVEFHDVWHRKVTRKKG